MNHSSKLFIAGALILGGIFMPVMPAWAATGGPNNPGTVASTPGADGHGTVAWTNPSNAQVQDSDYATATLVAPGQTVSNYLRASNFGFNLPDDATVLGIEVDVNRQASLTGIKDDVVKIFKGEIVGDNKADTSNFWPTTEAVASYGGSDDLWGQAWTAADINSSGFSLLISAKSFRPDTVPDTASVNSVQIVITYSVPDTTAPVITLLGKPEINLTVGDSYDDAGATALDDVDGDITDNIITTITLDTTTAVTPSPVDNVDTSVPAIFTIHYNVSDSAGNPAVEVTRTVNVNAAPAPVTHTLTYTAGPNGSITGTTPQEVNDGEDGVAVTATANAGFHFVNWSDGSTANPRTDTNVTGDISVTANFVADEAPGDTTPPTVTSYTLNGLAQNMTFNPNDPASVEIVINTDEPVKFTQIKIRNTIGAVVKTFNQLGEFSNTVTKMWDGKNAADDVVPDGVYTLQVNIKDAADNTNNNFDLTPHTITVDTDAPPAPVTHTLTYTAGPNGSITGTTPQEVNDGENGAAVTAVADAGFHFVDWSDGSTANPRTDTNVTTDISVIANFVADEVEEEDFDETIGIDANEWVLISAPQLLSEAPDISDDGGAVALLVYRNGAFVVPSAGDDELVNPLSAFFVKTANAGEVGFNWADINSPEPRQLIDGWNLVGIDNGGSGIPINEFSLIVSTNDPDNKGVTTLNAPTDYNDNKDGGGVWSGVSGSIDISRWATDAGILNPYDGYWVRSNAVKTYSLPSRPE